jgi:hypothetical protein
MDINLMEIYYTIDKFCKEITKNRLVKDGAGMTRKGPLF